VSSSPSPKGVLLHRLCPTCDLEILEERTTCAECGSKLVEIRDEIDTTVGTVIDERFEVRAKLGQGGMGTVYRAWQKSVGREVAIKLMDRSYSRDAMAVRRFLREARLASQLSQPNTVSVFDFGQAADGRLFIAMELIRGRTLHEVVKVDGAFSIERCARIGTQICDALEAAHGAGIIHRDLKLENVIVLDEPPGRDLLKVLDFGLAKNIRDPGSRATESGIVVGTPRYMSPEAATTGTTGPEGDVYSLGVILGELSSGRPLWSGDTLTELIAQKMSPASAVARTPAPLRPLLERLLDPDPEHRPTAPQVRASLQALGQGDPNAGDTVLDPEPNAGATTNLRSPSPQPVVTTQLTPGRLATAPTATPKPPTPRTSPSDLAARARPSLDVAEPSPSLAALDRPPVNRWPLVVVGLGAVVAVVVAVGIPTRADYPGAGNPPPPGSAAVTTPADASVATIAADAYVAALPAMVTLKVTSEPLGATVTWGTQSRKTPFEIVVERGTQPIVFTAKAPGRKDTIVEVVPNAESATKIVLPRGKRPNRPANNPSGEEMVPF